MTNKPPISLAQMKQETVEKPLSPAEIKKVDDRVGIIQLISGTTAKGEAFYAYVSFRPSLFEDFIRKMEAGQRIDIDSMGKVLQKGFGKEPDEEVKKYMEEHFGIDHDFMKHFEEEIEKRRKDKK